MNWAFWRRNRTAREPSAAVPEEAPEPPQPQDPAAHLRVRARRRLIGAAALLLAAVVIVPMVLDPAPRPIPDNIPIDIPSERAPFSPRLSLPPLPGTGGAGAPAGAPADATPVEANGKQTTDPGQPAPAEAGKRSEAGKAQPAPAESAAPPPAAAAEGKFAVQAAALGTDKAARDLGARLKKAGMPAYTERVETREGTRYRVRVGPFATRGEAESARARLVILGVTGSVVEP